MRKRKTRKVEHSRDQLLAIAHFASPNKWDNVLRRDLTAWFINRGMKEAQTVKWPGPT